ncbi:Uu.00g102200.m01.CDS01 [Anthostomella pinea]|uniref:Uu.00g102200.m01.CDS01 n=1 Tax=Anthostomella pinea TaxID=933095 RepID=A0AAI8VEC1_9PEZI|nr:Uu.00g102200.m01.CDS01 [Anthostomella pinea]
MPTPAESKVSDRRFTPEPDSISAEDVQQEFADIFAELREADETHSTISHLSSRFVTEPNVDFSGGWQLQLRNLWHLYYVAGKHCNEAAVSPLILQIVEISQRGVLPRNRLNSDGTAELECAPIMVMAGTRQVRQFLWVDLPLLVPAMREYWSHDCARMSRSQRVRISFFLGSLAATSTGQWAYGLCSIALVLLRDTLEKDRRLVRVGVEPGGEDSENTGQSTDMLTIADLLPAVSTWLVQAGSRIVQLCEAGDGTTQGWLTTAPPDDVYSLGPLAVEAGVQPVFGGFNRLRWFFWPHRLDAIGAEAPGQETGGNSTPFVQRVKAEKQMVRRVAHNMVYAASQSNSSIVQELLRMGRLPL